MKRTVLISIGLAAVTLATYAPVLRNDFVNYDDPEYVYDNAIVKQGLTVQGVRWAFVDSVGYASNWHPLTWLSHMLDWQLLGPRAAMHHLMSVMIHAVSVVLLFIALEQMTGCLWKSAFVAGVFALHPLHVESVAWIAERKDVLAAMFWMLTMLFYARYALHPGPVRYLEASLALLLGLLCKPMLVTLPLVLLLLDYWPLGRFPTAMTQAVDPARAPSRRISRLILEKLPPLLLCAGASVMTVVAQNRASAVLSQSDLSFAQRAANVPLTYARYLGQFVWPANLAVYYPYRSWTVAQVCASCLLMLGLTIVAIALARRAAYVIVGWLWFVGTLIPVIGIVQAGRQSMADRYMHIPMIGLALIVTWGACDLLRAAGAPRRAILTLGAITLIACAIRTIVQIGYWQNSETLFRHTLEIAGENNPLAHNNLGTALASRGDFAGAAREFQAVLQFAPDDQGAHRNLARAFAAVGNMDGAIAELQESLRLRESAFDENLLGQMLRSRGRRAEAIAHLARAVELEPSNTKYAADLAAARGEQ